MPAFIKGTLQNRLLMKFLFYIACIAAAGWAGWYLHPRIVQEMLAESLSRAMRGRVHARASSIASFAAATGGLDARSHAQKTLEALEAWIEGRDIAVAEYRIGDRLLKTIPIPDLLILRDRYRREVRAASGVPQSGRVYLRF